VPAEANQEVLFVGRLEHDKSIDVLLEAAKQIKARLRVIGDGPLSETLRARHPEAIFMGRLGRDEISRLCGRARLVAVPTRVRETFGLVALEGLMSGIPLITSSSALIADEIVRLGMGLACPPGDVDALAAGMTTILQDDNVAAAMSERGFKHARALAPTADTWCGRLLDLYRQKLAAADALRGARMAHCDRADPRS
jgi:glycosyltransferase involved in cell wall biosynthesis